MAQGNSASLGKAQASQKVAQSWLTGTIMTYRQLATFVVQSFFDILLWSGRKQVVKREQSSSPEREGKNDGAKMSWNWLRVSRGGHKMAHFGLHWQRREKNQVMTFHPEKKTWRIRMTAFLLMRKYIEQLCTMEGRKGFGRPFVVATSITVWLFHNCSTSNGGEETICISYQYATWIDNSVETVFIIYSTHTHLYICSHHLYSLTINKF